mmetsp:Transcript_7790/g.30841  ORF Transcript_7790/g.30841 Transcript_7790/m.30841 type:complete len:241 (+) Transcript_7790:1319-2041(+)
MYYFKQSLCFAYYSSESSYAALSAVYLPPIFMSWSCVPCSTSFAPSPSAFSRMQMRDALRIVLRRCAMTKVVLLSAFSSLRRLSTLACTRRSDSLSSAEVASSRRRMRGLPMIARAMAILCFCPPLTRPPPTPTSESYPFGILLTNSCALDILAASMTSSLVAGSPHLPAAMLSCTLPLNSVGSCSTMPICWRSHIGSRSRMSTPSRVMEPASGSLPSTSTPTRSSPAVFPLAADLTQGS